MFKDIRVPKERNCREGGGGDARKCMADKEVILHANLCSGEETSDYGESQGFLAREKKNTPKSTKLVVNKFRDR